MTRGRWVAVGVCTAVVAAATGLLYIVLYWAGEGGGTLRLLPYVALVLFVSVPIFASWLSGHATPLGGAAGGLALGIAATVAAAVSVERGGTGAVPLTLGIAVAGTISLRGNASEIWTRLIAIVVIAAYAVVSERFVSVLFVFPLLGVADELADVFASRRSRQMERETVRS